METLDGLDATFLSLETETVHLQVGVVMVLDPPEGRRSLFSASTRFDQIGAHIERRLPLAPPLRRRVLSAPLGLHRPVWADDPDFDLADHLRRSRLPAPGGWGELEELVAEVMATPLPNDRPLWEMVVVEGLEHDRTAVVIKVHHALLDGVSGAELLAAFLDIGPRTPRIGPAPEPWDPPALPGPVELLRRGARGALGQPVSVLSGVQTLIEAGLGLSERNQHLETTGDAPPPGLFVAPRTSLNGTVGSRRRYVTAAFPLAELRAVREVFGTTINDVVLSVVGASLEAILRNRGGEVPASLVALMPISVRPAGEGHRLGNQVTGTLIALPTDGRDALSRLQAVAEGAASAKAQSEVLGEAFVSRLAEAVPSAVSARAARLIGDWRVYDRWRPPANVTVSNVPGPLQSLWCAGMKVDALFPVGPVADGVGLNVTVLSYRETLHVGLFACRRLVPDLDVLASAMVVALGDLSAAARRRRGAAG